MNDRRLRRRRELWESWTWRVRWEKRLTNLTPTFFSIGYAFERKKRNEITLEILPGARVKPGEVERRRMEATKQALGWNVKEINNSKHWRRRPWVWLFYVCIKLTSSFCRNNEKFAGNLFARFIAKGETRLVRAKIIRNHDKAKSEVIMMFQMRVWKGESSSLEQRECGKKEKLCE